MKVNMPRVLSTSVGQRLKHPLQAGARRLGYEILPAVREESARYKQLFDRHQITLLIDVGANQGQYAQHMRSVGYQGDIVSFEPSTAAFRLLARRASHDPRWQVHRTALGSEPGEARLNVSQNSVSSSLLQLETKHVMAAPESKSVSVESVPVRCLDTYEFATSSSIWLKIDTQGFELQVLAGAGQILLTTQVLQVEASLTGLYAGQPRLEELLVAIDTAGFTVVDVIPGFRDPVNGDLLQVDLLAARR